MGDGYRGYKDLNVYQMAYQTALKIHEASKTFPKEERYALTDQIRRSSRSVPANIAEAWKKRRYQKSFVSKLIDCAGEAGETEVWLDFSKDFHFISQEQHVYFLNKYSEIGKMLFGMINKPEKFCVKT